MILLDKNNYDLAIRELKNVAINTLFARSVLLNHVPGSVYVNNIRHPDTFYIAHNYGMSLLYGNTDNNQFNSRLYDYMTNKNKIRTGNEWLQIYPEKWNNVLRDILGPVLAKEKIEKESGTVPENKIVEYTRVNFRFNVKKYRESKPEKEKSNYQIIRSDRSVFNEMPGTVIAKYFWNDADQFLNQGIGFSLKYNGEITSTAFTSYIHDEYYELGIETIEKFRGKGFAFLVCSSFIDYCLENNYIPVWSCRYDNTGSYRLALKLGFEPVRYLPYYKLII